ncbi:hypothetical protein GCM10022224_035820 [Nonomuraea antimicrobica]|uniref:Uncharacterized protein n=1 Tax=Nonomuraea antimicrobica TaxID=561173 RepID=A0ABP7BW02_9ACTN
MDGWKVTGRPGAVPAVQVRVVADAFTGATAGARVEAGFRARAEAGSGAGADRAAAVPDGDSRATARAQAARTGRRVQGFMVLPRR